MNNDASFLEELEQIAEQQAKLHKQRLLPSQLDWLGSVIGNYPWQILLFLSGITALLLRVLNYA